MSEDFIDSFAQDADSFGTLISNSDLDSVVSSCPGWRLRDLATHLGHVHRWASTCISEGSPVARGEPAIEDAFLAEWFREGAFDLETLLRERDPAAPTWTFGPEPRVMSFWSRRQAQETAVHLWDARAAIGSPQPIDENLAADGVVEVFEVFLPRQRKRDQLKESPQGIRIILPDGRSFDTGEDIEAEVSGAASDLLLCLWRRIPAEGLSVEGSMQFVRAFFSQALTP